jgi:hypothetical protein
MCQNLTHLPPGRTRVQDEKMITTDAWAFLNISHPVCAWAAYRGVLVSTRLDPGFLSIWTLSMIQSEDQHRIQRELSLEFNEPPIIQKGFRDSKECTASQIYEARNER